MYIYICYVSKILIKETTRPVVESHSQVLHRINPSLRLICSKFMRNIEKEIRCKVSSETNRNEKILRCDQTLPINRIFRRIGISHNRISNKTVKVDSWICLPFLPAAHIVWDHDELPEITLQQSESAEIRKD